ncbi:SOUL family heme-binding protein [Rubinisphaera italica]|uniref:SOUL heme-binding protein n=1 Tax=Rubinisphaera italica TaxID=2527969 RepID=A0A5C5XKB7_9PLAN|nr:heme-binding protein [Rubinisphaera italica]TWT62813.1 SOUL heme-binding protein [Rubinisphaera italica]
MRIFHPILRVGYILATGLTMVTSGISAEKISETETKAAGLLKQAIQKSSRNEDGGAALLDAAEQARATLNPNHYTVELLNDAIKDYKNRSDASQFQKALRNCQESITFRPVGEAKQPVGFPEWTPLHVIEFKKYPEYRMAEVQMKDSGNRSFWMLFNHIKRNKIAMTAPVEIGYDSNNENANEASMAFLYRDQDLGKPGNDQADSSVVVKDVPAMQVVSIGCRGNMNEQEVEAAREKLEEWLVDHPKYKISGNLRKLGYNSPMVPSFMRYYEVQIPVELK